MRYLHIHLWIIIKRLITGHVFVAEFFCLLLTLNPLLISLHPVDHNRDLHSVLFSLV